MIPIVIQGPTNYCKEVSEYYKDYFCVWSTWKSEPKENLDFLSSLENVHLILDDLPDYSDSENEGLTWEESWVRQRSRYEFTSTLNGFEYIKKIGFDYGIKIRSDMLLGIEKLLSMTDKKCFNCFAWHTGSVGYLFDYYFSGSVELIVSLMKKCLELAHPTHSENLMTYALLEELNYRNINYTLDENLYMSSLKHSYNTEFLIHEIKDYNILNKTTVNQISKNVFYKYSRDCFPDNYILTRGWGPK